MKNILRNSKRQKTPKKERMTVSLSQEAARFLRATRAELQAPSMSALLERIVADLQGRAEQHNYETQMRRYYDSLPPAAVQEERDWGAIGEAALDQPATER
jgi:uncharacterized protein with von Willebrand factor type A (vWA) domain